MNLRKISLVEIYKKNYGVYLALVIIVLFCVIVLNQFPEFVWTIATASVLLFLKIVFDTLSVYLSKKIYKKGLLRRRDRYTFFLDLWSDYLEKIDKREEEIREKYLYLKNSTIRNRNDDEAFCLKDASLKDTAWKQALRLRSLREEKSSDIAVIISDYDYQQRLDMYFSNYQGTDEEGRIILLMNYFERKDELEEIAKEIKRLTA